MDFSDLIPKFGPLTGTAFCLIIISIGLITYDLNTKTKKIESYKGKLSKDEINKIRDIINKFDRKAVSDQMHEENYYFMITSLNELNVDIRKLGIKTIAVPEIRDLFKLINQDLEDILHISLLINDTAKGSNQLLDLRSFGKLDSLKPYYNNYKINQYLQANFLEINSFLKSRLQRDRDSLKLADDISFVYFFGKIDQLKRDISTKLGLVQNLINDSD